MKILFLLNTIQTAIQKLWTMLQHISTTGFLSKPQEYPTAFAIKLQLNMHILKHIYVYSRSFTNDDNIFFQELQSVTVFTETSFLCTVGCTSNEYHFIIYVLEYDDMYTKKFHFGTFFFKNAIHVIFIAIYFIARIILT